MEVAGGDVTDRSSVKQATKASTASFTRPATCESAGPTCRRRGPRMSREHETSPRPRWPAAYADPRVESRRVGTSGAGQRPTRKPRPPMACCAPTSSPNARPSSRARPGRQGLNASIVNPGFMIGPNDWKPSSGKMLLQVARGWGLFAPLGANSYCDVRDVAAGIYVGGRTGQPGRRYILAGETLRIFRPGGSSRRPPAARPRVSGGPTDSHGRRMRRRYGYPPDRPRARRQLRRHGHVGTKTIRIECPRSSRARLSLAPLGEAAAAAWAWFRENGYV